MEVRRLCNGDEAAACQVVRVHKEREVTLEYMRAFLGDERHWLVAALDGGRPVGFALAYELARVDATRNKVLFYEIEVSEDHRRQGIGRALVEELKQLCRARGCRTMFVPTDEEKMIARETAEVVGQKSGVRS